MRKFTMKFWTKIKVVTSEDKSIICTIAGKNSLKDNQQILPNFSYISNLDNSIRWIYPKNVEYPTFLNFYNTSSFRSKFFSIAIRLAFILRLSYLVKSGDLNIQLQDDSILAKILKRNHSDGFSIFTGTVGENRKAVIELHNNTRTSIYAKIALTRSSNELIANESKRLTYLKGIEFNKLIIPAILHYSPDSVLEITNIKPVKYSQKPDLCDLHISSINELYVKTCKRIKWSNSKLLETAKQRIEYLVSINDYKNQINQNQVQNICNRMVILSELINEKELVTVSISHGDFTPWNMYLAPSHLHLFDWELSMLDTPLLFDFIHFIFQSTVMIKQEGYSEIHPKLLAMLRKKEVNTMLEYYAIDFNKNYIFYLIYNISYYLQKYIKQPKLHSQAITMINIWDDATEQLLKLKGKIT